jgi:EAL domain-containing protein (putative c-di-GMP-specific phosphodiesterase class I)
MGSGSSHVEIVQTIVTLAHALEMDVVAEGVETALQRKKLKDLGCEFGQGYLFAKPVDSETASDYIQGHGSWLASDVNRPVS